MGKLVAHAKLISALTATKTTATAAQRHGLPVCEHRRGQVCSLGPMKASPKIWPS